MSLTSKLCAVLSRFTVKFYLFILGLSLIVVGVSGYLHDGGAGVRTLFACVMIGVVLAVLPVALSLVERLPWEK